MIVCFCLKSYTGRWPTEPSGPWPCVRLPLTPGILCGVVVRMGTGNTGLKRVIQPRFDLCAVLCISKPCFTPSWCCQWLWCWVYPSSHVTAPACMVVVSDRETDKQRCLEFWSHPSLFCSQPLMSACCSGVSSMPDSCNWEFWQQ